MPTFEGRLTLMKNSFSHLQYAQLGATRGSKPPSTGVYVVLALYLDDPAGIHQFLGEEYFYLAILCW